MFINWILNRGLREADSKLRRAEAAFRDGDYRTALEVITDILHRDPTNVFAQELKINAEHNLHIALAHAHFPGPDYLSWLRWFHESIQPDTYLEIGVESGQSLAYAQTPTLAIGVDPALAIVHEQSTWSKLFKLTSDDFFASYDLKQEFNGNEVSFAFIDGLHTFDQALKDFINVERYARRDTVVLFHDIYPVIPVTAQRHRETRFWLGDTWKVILMLKKHRPDLTIFTIPAFPSGLSVVTNLDPTSNALGNQFSELVEQWMGVTLDRHMDSLANELGRIDNSEEALRQMLQLGK